MDTGMESEGRDVQAVSKWIIAITVMLPTLIEIIDTSVVNVSLDHIRGSLSAGIDEATWTITSYLVSNAIIIPMTGWFTRKFGRKSYLMFSVTLFTAASLMCGMAWNLQSLVFFRVLQGIGGGALQPLSQSILLETFPRRQHGMAMALFGAGIMFGPIAGPVLGGWITDNWTWHWIFFINVPIGIISIFMVYMFITDPSYVRQRGIGIDYMGILLLTVGVGSLQVVLDKGQRADWFASGYITALAAVAGVAIVLFLVNELVVEHPILNLRAFRDVTFSSGNLVMFFTFFNLFGSIVLLPIFVQKMMGYDATLAGMVLGPGALTTLVAMPIAGRLDTKVDRKALLTLGIITSAFAWHLMSRFNLYADFFTILRARAVLGFGLGFLFVPLTTMTMSHIRREDMGNATAIFNFLRNLGGGAGVAYVMTRLARGTQTHQALMVARLTPFGRNYQIAFGRMARVIGYSGAFGHALAGRAAAARLYAELSRQAAMLAYSGAFRQLSIFMIFILPLVFLMRKAMRGTPAENREHL
ncbi:MAG: DHA2 family efflux MFS transporter permease subunit [Nitrospiraceae bacterium]|nr:DHA2 family efflux MFS transporter permease subunit [Nitrospiraceae bacterium]